MEERIRQYIAIDLKSFYASVECVERGLNPLTTHLVVADSSRTEKTICLAVSPSLKQYGIGGRARLFEVVEKVRGINRARLDRLTTQRFHNKSSSQPELEQHPDWELDYIVAPPRMAHYIDYSCRIFDIYRQFVSSEDIHVYSIDEVFIDATNYLKSYNISTHELARRMITAVLQHTGITATAGIGTNLYLCKVAMDIVAKHVPADSDGVRIAELDERSYREKLWTHKPITDFWRVGHGLARRLAQHDIYTMGDIARCSKQNEELLYKLIGVNAELLIDHAWGWEPCTIEWIKRYRPESNSLSSSQVLTEPYPFDQARVVAHEMADAMALDLVDRHLVTDQVVLSVGYDVSNLSGQGRTYQGTVVRDFYGRNVPQWAHGTSNLEYYTSSSRQITKAVTALFDNIVDPQLTIRRLSIATNHVIDEDKREKILQQPRQLNLFAPNETLIAEREAEEQALAKEQAVQKSLLDIKKKFGKNAILKGVNFEKGATAKERNRQIGGHKA